MGLYGIKLVFHFSFWLVSTKQLLHQ